MRPPRWAVAVIFLWAAPAAAQLTHLQTYIWDGEHPSVRGISGIEITDDGTRFVAVSDFGSLLTGHITRIGGEITAMPVDQVGRILARSGRVTTGAEKDAEAVALLPNGDIAVAFERVHRVARFPDINSPATNIGTTDSIAGLVGNKGLEALAADAQGTLFAIPESPVSGLHSIYRFDGKTWNPIMGLPIKGSYLVVGADFGPDGDLWVLERKFIPPFFGSRIRRVSIPTAKVEVIWESRLGHYDNLESIAVWKAQDQETRVTLVADDNDKWFQRTEVVEFVLQD